MGIHGIACLYRCSDQEHHSETTATESEDSDCEKIEFDDPQILGKGGLFRFRDLGPDSQPNVLLKLVRESPKYPDKKSGIVSTTCTFMRTRTENAAPFQDESRKPDTGFAGTRYVLQCVFDESDTVYSKGMQVLQRWLGEPHYVKGRYPNGRFGFRNDFQPEFNINPSKTVGLKITRIESSHDVEYHQIRSVTIELEQSGDAPTL